MSDDDILRALREAVREEGGEADVAPLSAEALARIKARAKGTTPYVRSTSNTASPYRNPRS